MASIKVATVVTTITGHRIIDKHQHMHMHVLLPQHRDWSSEF